MDIKALAFIGVLLITGCSEVEENPIDCSDYTTGEFTFSKTSDIRIIRTDSYQKEYSLDDAGFVDTYGIKWTSSCSYKLWLQETTHPEDLDFQQGDTMYVEITAISPKGYAFKAAVGSRIFEREMYKID